MCQHLAKHLEAQRNLQFEVLNLVLLNKCQNSETSQFYMKWLVWSKRTNFFSKSESMHKYDETNATTKV